jgi:hypothetical protein
MTWPENATLMNSGPANANYSMDSNSAALISSPVASRCVAVLVEARRAWLQLEHSLEHSRKALLALDCAAVERETATQRALARQLEAGLGECAAIAQAAAAGASAMQSEIRDKDKDKQEGQSVGPLIPQFIEDLRLVQSRVERAARLQAALLSRAQARLHMLAQMMTGPGVGYGAEVVYKSGAVHKPENSYGQPARERRSPVRAPGRGRS